MRKLVHLLTLAMLVAATSAGPAVAGGGGGVCGGSFEDARGTTVTMTNSCFTPTVLRIGVGDEVQFVNEDPYPHTVTGAALVFGGMDELSKGDAATYRFDDEGVYPYVCLLHPSMAGAIVVGDGEGDHVGAVSYVPNRPAPDEPATEAAPTAATTSDTISWSIVPAALGALAVLAILSIRFRKRVSAGVALTTKP